ncbi:MAG: DUF1287 domain-containing protein [Terracidiphilus sp.]
MRRRSFLALATVTAAVGRFAWAAPSAGERLAAAARAQLGVTKGYDPAWTAIPYPMGDVPRSTGVCADVVVRAARTSGSGPPSNARPLRAALRRIAPLRHTMDRMTPDGEDRFVAAHGRFAGSIWPTPPLPHSYTVCVHCE